MGFYDLSQDERKKLVHSMEQDILNDIQNSNSSHINSHIFEFAAAADTYIRKNTYLILGRLYRDNDEIRDKILGCSKNLFDEGNEYQKQTATYLWGEIGKIDLDSVSEYFELAFNENSSKVKNAIMGSLKQLGEKNPQQTLNFAQKFLKHPDPEVRRVIIHGIELRGRTHPEDVLPLLYQVQDEKIPRVRNMVIHVIGQISYKEGCLEKVVSDLVNWENEDLVRDSLDEILEVHKRYKFASKSQKEAESYIKSKFGFNFFLNQK